ncbi:heavy metal translocating P-type ATPase [Candidatus Leptofilum sp.]|uniref:heavy metal translocating P-type ATPase n=1 Tax=Candidatus Leptofilum sp. TaxID=3241576 RepID=UPI003B5A1745
MVSEVVACDLCGLPAWHPIAGKSGGTFCCPSCHEVSNLLREAEVVDEVTGSSFVNEGGGVETAVFSLGGLWCPSCAWLIRERLSRTPGVAEAEVSFLQREARVCYDPERVRQKRIMRRVRQLGYNAWPEGKSAKDEEEAHWNRLLISGVLTMHIMLLSFMIYFRQWTGRASVETEWLVHIFEIMILFMSVPTVLILGLPILRAGLAGLLRGQPNTHTLIAVGAFSAFGLSLRNFLVGQGDIYFDTAAVLLFLVAIGRWLEMRAHKVSSRAVEQLWQRMPPQATWLTADGEQQIAADAVPPGARLLVRPGERFPVDGIVAVGQGDVDESLLTGEPEAVCRRRGARVLAGTINLDGSFEVIASATGTSTMMGQIGHLLHQALWQRSPVERLADRVAAWMTPTAVLLATITFIYWSNQAGFEVALIYSLSVLLIACPCALGIATPLSLWLSLGRATELGIILHQTGVLEQLAQVNQVFLDKTGTLTQRPLRVQTIATEQLPEAQFMAWVTAVEANSEHPVAQAIVADVPLKNRSLRIENFRALPGEGVTALVDDLPAWVGSYGLMKAVNLSLSAQLADVVRRYHLQGLRVIYAGWAGCVQGVIGLGERLRPETAVTLQTLTEMGMQVSVLTGDDAIAGRRWQAQLGVPVHAALTPAEKVAQLQSAGAGSLMVGDGINDGPALAAASVGIAVSQGTDIAQEAADAILIQQNLTAVPWLLKLSRRTMQIVRQNLVWAFIYNIVGLGLAMTGHLQPALAALLMVLSSAVVTGNAFRLRKFPIGAQQIESAGVADDLSPSVPNISTKAISHG